MLAALLSASRRRGRPGRAMRKTKARTTKRKAAARGAKKKAKPAKPKTKAKAKPKAKAKASPRGKRKTPARRHPVALGAVVRIPRGVEASAGAGGMRSARTSPGHRELRGIVCAIRDVTSGKPVTKTRGDLGKYVLELLHEMTFDREYSSAQNAGGRGAAAGDGPTRIWERARAMIQKKLAASTEAKPAMALLADEELRRSLDGWRLIRVKADSVVVET